ncbi:MAG: hypothetical protein EHM58_10545 [Ignavibacteriae bacterium]|nr:MAG: hypothetical protein EHM58_10545 [Ignavibacteriota bacterium]
MIIADLIWPAAYIVGDILTFWYIVILTIAFEAAAIKIFLSVPVLKSILISLVGNIVSAIMGTLLFMFLSLIIEGAIGLVFQLDSFSTVSWILNYIFMCFGSILIEILVVMAIWKYSFKKLFIPLSIGNVLSYLIIFYLINFNIFHHGVEIQT